MRLSKLFTKTSKTQIKDAESLNAKLLTQAGYIHQEMAGVYSFLPLGLRVLNKIENIVRQEMNAIDGQEMLMSALAPKEAWDITGRWNSIDILFKVPAAEKREYALNSTHEEIITPIVKQYAFSYKDLPVAVYQIQTKFRNEPRAKSGILRGREFRMKDLYSFHASEEDRKQYYQRVAEAYHKIFSCLGIGPITYYTFASGGDFTKEYSHEFQTQNRFGEDTIYLCGCGVAHNKEIFEKDEACLGCGKKGEFQEIRATEVGNIFPLGTRFSEAIGYTFTAQDGSLHPVIMGSYGIGTSRLMGVIAESCSDEHGLSWPQNIAPYHVNLISIGEDEEVKKEAENFYKKLERADVQVLFDDRDIGTGQKFVDHDLLGIPYRVIVSQKTLLQKKFEFKERKSDMIQFFSEKELITFFTKFS